MHGQYQPDTARGQYVPPPPPQMASTPGAHGIALPPPPPRMPSAQQHGMALPPPPPGGAPPATPITGYWNRGTAYPPPPATTAQYAPYNPNAYQPYQPSLPPPPADPPLTSATYIPFGESFGPGVGIPPLHTPSRPHPDQPTYFSGNSEYSANVDSSRNNVHTVTPSDESQGHTGYGALPGAQTSRQGLAMNLRDAQEYNSPGPPTATLANTHGHNGIYPPRANDTAGNTPVSPNPDAGLQWPLDRVLSWLANNGFSSTWQDAFKTLDLHGSAFLEIGKGHGTKGNVAMTHEVLLPQLKLQCQASGTPYDEKREREEGRRLRRFVRSIVESGNANSAKAAPTRRASLQFLHSAGTEGTLENSPHLPEYGSTPTTAGGGEDDSPGRHLPVSFNSPSSANPKRLSTQRNFTVPTLNQPSEYLLDNGHRNVYTEKALRSLEGVSSKKHSPNTSSDMNHREAIHQPSPQNSPATTSARLSGGQTRYYSHNRTNSSESSVPLYAGSAKTGEGRRNGLEGTRQPPENAQRHNSGEIPTSATTQHRGFFDKWKRRDKKNHENHPSPEESSLDSPTSPVVSRHFPFNAPFSKMNSSETSLNERPPSRTSHNESAKRHRGSSKRREKKFVFITPDGWNYRLVDVTDAETAVALRDAVCEGLGIANTSDISLHLTSPGQCEHDEGLSDKHLVKARDKYANALGDLKIFVNIPASAPGSAALGGTFNVQPSPFKAYFNPPPPEDGAYSRHSHVPDLDSPVAPSGESTLVPSKAAELRNIGKNEGINPDAVARRLEESDRKSWAAESEPTETERKDLLEAAEEHRREAERKGEEYLRRRREQLRKKAPKESPDALSPDPNALGIIRQGVIDFDERRDSPYEDKRRPFEDHSRRWEPMRNPPPVPPDSNTSIRANSLTKKKDTRSSWPGDEGQPKKHPGDAVAGPSEDAVLRRKAIPAAPAGVMSGIGAALVGAGIKGSMVGAPTAKPPVKPTASPAAEISMKAHSQRAMAAVDFGADNAGRHSEGAKTRNESTTTPQLAQNGFPAEPSFKAYNPQQQQRPRSADVSPNSAQPAKEGLARQASRHSVWGPTLDFKEAHVPFHETSPRIEPQDSDDDSDEGLFAKPLAKNTPSTPPSKGTEDASPGRTPRPSLTLKTSRSRVAFNSPDQASVPQSAASENTMTPDANDKFNSESAASATWSIDSPDESSRFLRRESFASDVWANRPPPEALVEHLDEFFPNVNLDQPMVEDEFGEPPSPTTSNEVPKPPTDTSRATTPMSTADDGTVGASAANLKRGDTVQSMAQRNMRKAGGLGRTKSIREVVKNQYHSGPKPPLPGPSRINTLKSGDIVRRKSTKMFNARIEQVKPHRGGSRLMNLESIPQDHLPVPQRQPTFKWMKGQLIGKGTFGRVYLGMNITTGELIAVKQVEVNPKAAGQDKDKMKELVRSLDSEIDTMQNLDHPNIVQYLGCERKEYSISIFLEYISGGSVGSCLRKHGKFDEPIVSSLTRQTLNGLAYLHGQGILHRDLKADNILLDLDGTCKISDFGISKRTDNIYGNDVTNSMQGSVFWMAPEVIRSHGQGYSAKVDIWSLGCVVLEMFAGRRPWSKEEAIGAIYKLGSLNQAPPIPDDVSSKISPAALSFMYDCFTIDPSERPTADTLLRAPFCFTDPSYNFLDTELYAKIRGAF